MKALSVKQPWAWLIVNGRKDIENRTWATKYRGRVLIHASKKVDTGAIHHLTLKLGVALPSFFETGGIVGEAEIANCVTYSQSGWFEGPHGFVMQNAKPLPFMPCLGKLGFFEVEYKEPNV